VTDLFIQILKLILGAIDPSYDTKDEKSNRPQGGAPAYGAPQQYGGQGQNQFAPPPGAPQSYGQQQGGYGQGYPPQQQQQYGAPPQQQGGYPSQQYGAPPQQQGGYPGQQPGGSQYGAPPPPRY
jgi:hypothetical protein